MGQVPGPTYPTVSITPGAGDDTSGETGDHRALTHRNDANQHTGDAINVTATWPGDGSPSVKTLTAGTAAILDALTGAGGGALGWAHILATGYWPTDQDFYDENEGIAEFIPPGTTGLVVFENNNSGGLLAKSYRCQIMERTTVAWGDGSDGSDYFEFITENLCTQENFGKYVVAMGAFNAPGPYVFYVGASVVDGDSTPALVQAPLTPRQMNQIKVSMQTDGALLHEVIAAVIAAAATDATTKADAKVADAINDGTTTVAPSQNAVFDALALKANAANPTLTGTVTVPDASFANAKLANMAARTFKGRHTDSTGAPEDVSAANVLSDLIAAAGTPTGTKFIRDDGTLATPAGSALWTVIAEGTLGTAAASISVSNLGAYGDFIMEIDGLSSSSGDDFLYLLWRFNGDTAANYESDRVTYSNIVGTGSSGPTRTASTSLGTSMVAGAISGSKTNTDRRGQVAVAFSSRGTAYRQLSALRSVARYASTNAVAWMLAACLWRSTAGITSVSVSPEVGNFVAGTYYRLLGRA